MGVDWKGFLSLLHEAELPADEAPLIILSGLGNEA